MRYQSAILPAVALFGFTWAGACFASAPRAGSVGTATLRAPAVDASRHPSAAEGVARWRIEAPGLPEWARPRPPQQAVTGPPASSRFADVSYEAIMERARRMRGSPMALPRPWNWREIRLNPGVRALGAVGVFRW